MLYKSLEIKHVSITLFFMCFVSFVSTACVSFSSPRELQGNQNRVTRFIVSLAPYPAARLVYNIILLVLFYPIRQRPLLQSRSRGVFIIFLLRTNGDFDGNPRKGIGRRLKTLISVFLKLQLRTSVVSLT